MTRLALARARVRGLYGIADAGASGGDPERLGRQLLAGGCRLVQVRCKGWSADELLRVSRALRGPCREVGALLIVNDDADVAVAADADALHVGQTDGDTDDLRRRLGPDRLLGRSTNDLDELARAALRADYVAFGPVFETPRLSRPKPVRGLERLAAARAAVVGVPLVAIGGIDASNLAAVRATGVDAWAVIGAVANASDPVAAARALA